MPDEQNMLVCVIQQELPVRVNFLVAEESAKRDLQQLFTLVTVVSAHG